MKMRVILNEPPRQMDPLLRHVTQAKHLQITKSCVTVKFDHASDPYDVEKVLAEKEPASKKILLLKRSHRPLVKVQLSPKNLHVGSRKSEVAH